MKLSQRRLARPSLGGMLATRQGSLTVAVVCAACAAGILIIALNSYKTKVHTPTPQATVLIAKAEIPKGTTGATIVSEHLYQATPVAASQVTPGAISDATVLTGATAQADILPGSQLTNTDFSSAEGVTGTLAPDQRAISVSIDEAHGDTDVLQAGDSVDVYVDISDRIVLLDPDVLVIKPATSTPTKSGGTTVTGGSLVLAVNTDKVAEFDYANDNDHLYLALRPTNASTSSGMPVTGQSLIASSIQTYGSAANAANSTSNTSNNGN